METDGLPAYPPARNAWDYPPPPISPRWKWVAIAAGFLSLVAATALVAVAISVTSRDNTGLIEDARLLDAISRECAIMTFTIESTPLSGDVRQQVAIIRDQDAAVATMVEAIRELDPHVLADDKPTAGWLDDWDRLVGARETLAAGLEEDLGLEIVIPKDEKGHPIDERMDKALLGGECTVPADLLDPNRANNATI